MTAFDGWMFDSDQPNYAIVTALLGSVCIVVGGFIDLSGAPYTNPFGGLNPFRGPGLLGLISGSLIAVLAILLYGWPRWHLGIGIAIILLSVASIFGGGLFLGSFLGLFGGVTALYFVPLRPIEWKPRSAGDHPLPTSVRTCPNCEVTLPSGALVCENCGHSVAPESGSS